MKSLAGRNWLGCTFSINVVNCCSIVPDIMADPRGREAAGGSGICSNKRSKKMRKKIIGAGGGRRITVK